MATAIMKQKEVPEMDDVEKVISRSEEHTSGSSWMAESIASQRRVSMTGSITWNNKKQGVDQADFVCIDILNFYLDLRYDIRKNTNTKKDRK